MCLILKEPEPVHDGNKQGKLQTKIQKNRGEKSKSDTRNQIGNEIDGVVQVHPRARHLNQVIRRHQENFVYTMNIF